MHRVPCGRNAGGVGPSSAPPPPKPLQRSARDGGVQRRVLFLLVIISLFFESFLVDFCLFLFQLSYFPPFSVFCLFMHYLGMQQENGEGHERRVKSPLKTSSSLFSRENEEKRKVEVTEGVREGQVVRCK